MTYKRKQKEIPMTISVKQLIIPVDDQERAKTFWVEQMGFEITSDETFGDERWIEVSPPGQSLVLVLSRREPHETRHDAPDHLPNSDIFFTCDDLEKTYQELSERGVKFAVRPEKQAFGWWSMFEDQEGTRYALGQV
jgi:predicted enzyme related to lactoylglutathione lyase